MAMPENRTITVAVSRGPNRNAAQASRGTVRYSNEKMPPNTTVPTIRTADASNAPSSSRSRVQVTRWCRLHNSRNEAMISAPDASPSHHVSHTGPRSEERRVGKESRSGGSQDEHIHDKYKSVIT